MTKVKVFFATNRNLITSRRDFDSNSSTIDGRDRFGIHPSDFRVGTAKVKVLDVNGNENTENIIEHKAMFIVGSLKVFPEVYEEREYSSKGSDKLFPAYMEELNTIGKKQTNSALVVIPGFNYNFEESIERAALLSHIYSTDENHLIPFVFSWPSDGKLWFSYDNDLRDAKLSGETSGRTFRAFIRLMIKMKKEEECISSAFLIAHSMGAYALRFAVKELQRTPSDMKPIFNSIIIAGADEESDCFLDDRKMPNLFKLTSDVIVYANKADKALRHADNQPSLGHHGPASRTADLFKEKLTVIRCHEVDYPYYDPTRHQYYRISREVVQDISLVMQGVEKFEDREPVSEGVYKLVKKT